MKPQKLLPFILTMVMAISILPTFAIAAKAEYVDIVIDEPVIEEEEETTPEIDEPVIEEEEEETTPEIDDQTDEKRNISLGTSALSGYDSTKDNAGDSIEDGYKYIYYGTYDNKPIKWRILTKNGNNGTYYESTPYTPTTAPTSPLDGREYTDDSGAEFIYFADNKNRYYYKKTTSDPMFLLSEYALAATTFGAHKISSGSSGPSVTLPGSSGSSITSPTIPSTSTGVPDLLPPVSWQESTAWRWCNSFISGSFTDNEKQYILKTSKDNSLSKHSDELKGDMFFFLSCEEADNDYIKNNLPAKQLNDSNSTASWWLRSPLNTHSVYYISTDGERGVSYDTDATPAARPAFNLDVSSVLFTSSANTQNSVNEYKLTMEDSTRNEFTAKVSNISGNQLTVSYTDAKTGENEYISVIIVNTYGDVTYYGKLANVTAESGTVMLDLTDITFTATDKIYIFNEQLNGDCKTDFASELTDVTSGIILTNDKVSAWFAGGDAATLIVASYKGKELKAVKKITLYPQKKLFKTPLGTQLNTPKLDIYEKSLEEIGLDTTEADRVKAFLWENITMQTTKLTPLCEAQEVILSQSTL